MSVVLGLECKAYRLTSGTRATWGAADGNGIHTGSAPASLSEVTVAKNVTVTLGAAEADVSSRASIYKLIRKALRDLSIDLEMPWTPSDGAFAALQASYILGTSIAMAFLDGDKSTSGSQGPWADWEVTEFTREEPIEGAAMAKVKIKPTSSAVAPEWVKAS